MGGWGSGGYQVRHKGATTDMRQLDVRDLARKGRLYSGMSTVMSWNRGSEPYDSMSLRAEGDTLIAEYSRQVDGGEWQPRQETLDIQRTPCHLGGSRPWFHCPVCWRRCAILYFTQHGFLCRTCAELNYPSTRQTPRDRALLRVQAIRRRLGWPIAWFQPDGAKPEGMRWREYYRLVWKHDAELQKVLTSLDAWLDKQHHALEKRIKSKKT